MSVFNTRNVKRERRVRGVRRVEREHMKRLYYSQNKKKLN